MSAPAKRVKAPLFVVAFALFWALAPAAAPVGEARTIATSARALAFTGSLDVATLGDGASLPGTVAHNGRRRLTGELGALVVLVPAELIVRATQTLDRTGRVARLAESATAAACAALLCAIFFGALLRHGLSPRASLLFTFALAFATPLVWFARIPDGTALAALLLYWAVLEARAFVAQPRGGELGLGVTLGALVIVDPMLTLAALLVLAWCGLHRHQRFDARTAAQTLGPFIGGLLLVLAHRALVGAQREPAGDVVQGLVGFILAPGKSLFVYAPLTVLAIPSLISLWRVRRPDAELFLVVAAALLLAAARLEEWHGDPTWGPRRIVPLVPLAVEAVALAWHGFTVAERRRLHTLPLVVLCAAGLFVQTVGIALAPTTYLDVLTEVRMGSAAPSWFAASPDEAHFIPQFSPVLGHAWLLSHMLRRDRRFDVNPPWKLLLTKSPPLPDLLPRLTIDWLPRTLPTPLAAGWLALDGVALVLAAWLLRRRLMLL